MVKRFEQLGQTRYEVSTLLKNNRVWRLTEKHVEWLRAGRNAVLSLSGRGGQQLLQECVEKKNEL